MFIFEKYLFLSSCITVSRHTFNVSYRLYKSWQIIIMCVMKVKLQHSLHQNVFSSYYRSSPETQYCWRTAKWQYQVKRKIVMKMSETEQGNIEGKKQFISKWSSQFNYMEFSKIFNRSKKQWIKTSRNQLTKQKHCGNNKETPALIRSGSTEPCTGLCWSAGTSFAEREEDDSESDKRLCTAQYNAFNNKYCSHFIYCVLIF